MSVYFNIVGPKVREEVDGQVNTGRGLGSYKWITVQKTREVSFQDWDWGKGSCVMPVDNGSAAEEKQTQLNGCFLKAQNVAFSTLYILNTDLKRLHVEYSSEGFRLEILKLSKTKINC